MLCVRADMQRRYYPLIQSIDGFNTSIYNCGKDLHSAGLKLGAEHNEGIFT